MKALGVGIGTCVEKLGPGTCSEGCWVQAEKGDGYSLLDANRTSIIGPALKVTEGCGCSGKETTKLVTFEQNKVCPTNACLNGGRCLPTRDSYK